MMEGHSADSFLLAIIVCSVRFKSSVDVLYLSLYLCMVQDWKFNNLDDPHCPSPDPFSLTRPTTRSTQSFPVGIYGADLSRDIFVTVSYLKRGLSFLLTSISGNGIYKRGISRVPSL